MTQPHAEPLPGRLETLWNRAYSAKTRTDLVELYADWVDTYDEDHQAIGFFGHHAAAQMMRSHLKDLDSRILDAGAGTGAAGHALSALGYQNLVAADLSEPMLQCAAAKKIYREHQVIDLAQPLDSFPSDSFDACILVGVFSYGQAPACALEELIRIVRPGGTIVFTMRTDFFESNAMGVNHKMQQLVQEQAWKALEVSPPQQYLPQKDPSAMFRVWSYQTLPTKRPQPSAEFVCELRAAISTSSPVKRIDHSHIWNRIGSRLYDEYIQSKAYYLNNCEEALLQEHGSDIVGSSSMIVELGCGSARKIRYILDAALRRENHAGLVYLPLDISREAIDATCSEVREAYGDRVKVIPHLGRFDQTLAQIPNDAPKTLFFFGSSLGNFKTLDATAQFLAGLRRRMLDHDRLIVGIDLDKSPEIILDAYRAGPENLAFFLNMVRRINHVLGAQIPLDAFELAPTYEVEPEPDAQIQSKVVDLRLVATRNINEPIERLDQVFKLSKGESLSVGKSRKFGRSDISTLARRAGLHLRTQWVDSRQWYSVNELLPDKAARE